MKFFVPGAETEKATTEIYDAIRKFAGETTGWQISDRRILSITFGDKGRVLHAEVGQTEPMTGEKVIAVLESTTFLVCTPNRGVVRGVPILVGKPEVVSVVDFES